MGLLRIVSKLSIRFEIIVAVLLFPVPRWQPSNSETAVSFPTVQPTNAL
jgi:hypothetical protein